MAIDNGNDAKWKGRRKDRDDTPSVIRNVDARAQMLGPGRGGESIPVLAIPTSIKLWQKVRWPLLVTVVLIILVAVGFFTNDILVARSVEQQMKDASIGEESAHVAVMIESNRILQTLAERHRSRLNVQAAYAWNAVLIARIFDGREKFQDTALPAMEAISGDRTALGYAARAGALVVEGDTSAAKQLADEGVAAHPDEPRIRLVGAWVKMAEGDMSAAHKALLEIRETSPDYLPPLYSLLEIGIQEEDRRAIATHSLTLTSASKGNVYGALTSLMVRLPDWTGDPLSVEELTTIAGSAASIASRVKEAPLKLRIYASFLQGRVALEMGEYKRALAIFKKILDDKYNLNVLAWYGKALLAQEGPDAALTALDAAGDNPRFEIHDLRARCYLDRYQVAESQAAVDALVSQEGLDLAELKWILAVRTGDVKQAKELLPEQIGGRLKFVALEMYEILQRTGDRDGISSLLDTMDGGAAPCAKAIKLWHAGKVTKVFDYFQIEDSCVAALGLRLLKSYYRPTVLAKMSALVEKDPNANLRMDVDRASAVWKTDGLTAAKQILDNIVNQKPESGPLLAAVGNAYMEMGFVEEALEVVTDVQYPEAIALLIKAWNKQKRSKKADVALENALKDDSLKSDPAIVTLALRKKLDDGALDYVMEQVDAAMPRAGIWSSEMAELKASAMSTLGEKGEADRYLAAVGKDVVRPVGLHESWQLNHAIVRMNLRRGGKYVFKATEVILDVVKRKRIDDSLLFFSHGVVSAREGNVRGAERYFNDAIEIDPTLLEAYQQLNVLGEITEAHTAALAKLWPDFKFE